MLADYSQVVKDLRVYRRNVAMSLYISQATKSESIRKLFQNSAHVTDRLMIKLPTKFEVSMFTRYEDMKGNAKCRK